MSNAWRTNPLGNLKLSCPSQQSFADKRFWLLCVLVSMLPAMLLLPNIIHTWVNIPFYDDWGTPGYDLVLLCQRNFRAEFAHLFAQHNESRPFFPRLVFIPLGWFGGWDVRRMICASFAMVCAASVLLHGLIRRLPSIKPVSILGMSLLTNLILFWPNSEVWAYSNTFMIVCPPVLLLCATRVNRSRIPFRSKILSNAILALVSTYSWANGMVLWLLAIPLSGRAARMDGFSEKQETRIAKWYCFYGVAALIAVGSYFHGYHRPASNPPFSRDVILLQDYFFTWAGAFWGNPGDARVAGILAFVCFLSLLGAGLWFSYANGSFNDYHPWLLLGLYALASGVVASAGRGAFGVSQAMSPRYSAVSGYLYISILGLGYLVIRDLCERLSRVNARLLKLATVIALGLCIPFTVRGYGQGLAMLKSTGEHREALLTAWEWSRAIPENPAIKLLSPSPAIFNDFGNLLENHRLLRVRRWDPQVTTNWTYNQKAANAKNGMFSSCTVSPDNWLEVSGWSSLPDGRGPADYVLITSCEANGVPRPFTILPSDLESPDVAVVLRNEHMTHSGFHMGIPLDNLSRNRISIAAWSVDMKTGMILPLARTFILDNR